MRYPHLVALLACTLSPVLYSQQSESTVMCTEGSEPHQISYGQGTVGCAISPSIDSDLFEFVGAQGDLIRISVLNGGGPLDPVIELRDPSGSILATGSCSGGCCAGVTCSLLIQETLPSFGLYSITVTDGGGDESGGYTLQLESLPPALPAPHLESGMSTSGQISPAIDYDFVTFSGNAGSTVRLQMNNGGGPLDARAELVDPLGNLTALSSCSGGCCGGVPCSFQVDLDLTQSGIYVVILSDAGRDESGSYTLSLNCIAGNCLDPYPAFCAGDGGDTMGCTDCPCGNNAPGGTLGGCLNASGTSCRLVASGQSSVASDTLRFDIAGASPFSFGLLVSASNQLPAMGACPPGSGILVTGAPQDGLRCIGGNFMRHGSRVLDQAGANFAPWGPPGPPASGLIAQSGLQAGQTRQWQVFYRDDAQAQCGTGQNTSNAVSVVVTP